MDATPLPAINEVRTKVKPPQGYATPPWKVPPTDMPPPVLTMVYGDGWRQRSSLLGPGGGTPLLWHSHDALIFKLSSTKALISIEAMSCSLMRMITGHRERVIMMTSRFLFCSFKTAVHFFPEIGIMITSRWGEGESCSRWWQGRQCGSFCRSAGLEDAA